MRAYNITLAGKVIDTVYFPDGTPESEIRHGLINTVSGARSKYLDPGIVIEAQLSRSEIVSAIEGAIATRGKNKGQLKAKCPPSNTDAAAAWQAIQMEANPYKVSMATCLFFSDRQTKIFNAVIETIRDRNIDVRGLDRDRVALENLGAW